MKPNSGIGEVFIGACFPREGF